MKETISHFLSTSASIKQQLAADDAFVAHVAEAATALKEAVKAGGTIYSCGNGGSSCDAMHFTEELVARYKRERPGIRAMHMHDPSVLTCWSNDYEYESAFERQVETFCKAGDILVGISTSGNSSNVLRAVQAAKSRSVKTIGLTGKDGGKLATEVDIALVIPSEETDRIQEVHINLIHIFCELLET
jgi:D-sedoheptulose 7-phosphate isomerase